MKTILKATIAAFALTLTACCSEKACETQTEVAVTNKVQLKAFQDERYVWESWQYSTNRANATIK